MRVPLAWLREYVDLPSDPEKVAEMLAQIGFPVEEIERRPAITGVVAGRIEQLEKHPNADRLQVGKINAGNGALLTIATAATNVAQGQTIPVATIGAQLPHIKIERRKMRGLESEGMMVSADELALPPEWFEDGIMQLERDVPLGTDLVEYFRLSEAVLEVEVTSNRVDAMSIAGLARELAAYQGVPLRTPELAPLREHGSSKARVTIESPDCPQFVLADMTGIRVAPSPVWMRIRLALAGQRPISNVVDISNYVMLEFGQPLHFYDAAHVPAKHLIVRDAKDGERLVTLDGENHELSSKDLVIASERGPEGFAGLMGGESSEVGASTTEILIEGATFSGARVRRMSARHGLRTEAGTRHEKGLPLALAAWGTQRAIDLLQQTGARLASVQIVGSQAAQPAPIRFELREVKRLLGFALSAAEATEFLDRLGFAVEPAGADTLAITPPAWRRDVSVSADIVEELARMAGYDRIESSIPHVPAHEIAGNDYLLETRIAQTLYALGYQEIVTIAMHGDALLERLNRAGLRPSRTPVEILNPLSEDQRYLRFALGPAHIEYFARIDRPVRVFEIGHTFSNDDTGPVECAMLTFGFSADVLDEASWQDSHFRRLKGDAEALLHALTGRRDFDVAADKRNGAHPGKTAALLLEGREIAFICQVDPRLQKSFDCRLPVYGCWIYLDRIPEYRAPRYRPASKYPSTYRDLALLCPIDLASSRVAQTIAQSIGPLCTHVRAFDEYRGAQVGEDRKSLAVRVTLQRFDTTITDEEADEAVARALDALSAQLAVTLRT